MNVSRHLSRQLFQALDGLAHLGVNLAGFGRFARVGGLVDRGEAAGDFVAQASHFGQLVVGDFVGGQPLDSLGHQRHLLGRAMYVVELFFLDLPGDLAVQFFQARYAAGDVGRHLDVFFRKRFVVVRVRFARMLVRMPVLAVRVVFVAVRMAVFGVFLDFLRGGRRTRLIVGATGAPGRQGQRGQGCGKGGVGERHFFAPSKGGESNGPAPLPAWGCPWSCSVGRSRGEGKSVSANRSTSPWPLVSMAAWSYTRRPKRKNTAGVTIWSMSVESSRPPITTIASGCRISLPVCPAPSASGTRPIMATRPVIGRGASRSSLPQIIICSLN